MTSACIPRLAAVFLTLLSLTLTGCISTLPVIPTEVVPTTTLNPFSTPTATPFSPATYTPTASIAPSYTATITPLPLEGITPASLPTSKRTQYTLNVSMDYKSHHLSVNETIIYPNQTNQLLDRLVMAVEPNRWSDTFTLDSLTINGQASTGHILNGIRLEIPLITPLTAGEIVALSMHYELYFPQTSPDNIFGYNAWQMNAVDWYPFIVPFNLSLGWVLHEPAEVGEHLVYDTVDFEVSIQWTDPSLPITIAASAPAEQTEQGLYFWFENARTFVFSASTDYLTSSTAVESVVITSYYFEGDQIAGEAALREVAKAVVAYSDYFAKYPYPSLSIVEVFFPDGMEYAGLFFLSRTFYATYDGTAKNDLTVIAVHEAAHEWWFGLVGNDQAIEPWLDEALATYSERIYYELNYPRLLNWWWEYRINSYKPTGWVDTDIYHGGSFRAYTNAVYLRGAKFLEALRTRLRDATFFTFLNDYAVQMSNRCASADDFFNILRQHTSVDISNLISLYFQNPH